MMLGFAATASGQSMLECSRLESEAERLECYDRVAGRVEKQLEEKRVGTTEQRVEARNEAVAEEVVGAKPDAVVPDVLTLEIGEVLRDRNGRVTYKTTDFAGCLMHKSGRCEVDFRFELA